VTRTPQDGAGFESLLAWETYEKAQAQSNVPQPIRGRDQARADKRNTARKKKSRVLLANVYAKSRPTFDPLNAKIETLNKQRADIDARSPRHGHGDMPQLRETTS